MQEVKLLGREEVAAGTQALRFTWPQGFEFKAGQAVDLVIPVGADPEARHAFSIASAPQEPELVFATRMRDSAYKRALGALPVGAPARIDGPFGSMTLHKDPKRPAILVAGGIGITPIRSMIRHLRNTSDRPWKLYYLCRDAASTPYADELADPALRGKVLLHHDRGDPAQSYDLWPVLEKPKGAHLYCCGPKGLMDAVRDMTGHWSSSAVHFEDFAVRNVARGEDDKPFVVRFQGESIEVAADESILHALRAAGHRIPSSCESGTCGSCRMKLVGGEADHRDLVLTDEERLTNIMVCVSRARSPEIAIGT